MNITEFKRKLIANRPLKDSRFEVVILPPQKLAGQWSRDKIETLQAYAKSVNISGRNLLTHDVLLGKSIQVIYGDTYNTMTVSLMLDTQYHAKNLFDDWQNAIIDRKSSVIKAFYKEYVTDIFIHHKDESDEIKQTIRLAEAFPSVVGDISLSKESTNQFTNVEITFSFKNWEIVNERE